MLIIANQQKNLFTNIKNLEQVEFYREELDIGITNKDGQQVAYPIYGDYIVTVNKKVYARYKTAEQNDQAKELFIKSFLSNNRIFIFPIFKENSNLVINYAS